MISQRKYAKFKMVPVRAVGKSAFVVVRGQASVRQESEVEHEQFDKWFDHYPLILVLERAQFAALPETEVLGHSGLEI